MTDTTVFTSGGFSVKSIDDIAKVAPAVLTEEIHPGLSKKYTKISTIEIIKSLEKFGWTPISARQIGEGIYGRHIVRLSNTKSGILKNIKVGDIIPQFVLDNSNDGTHFADLNLGLFRTACENGWTVPIAGMSMDYSFRHTGHSDQKIKEIVESSIENFNFISQHIKTMQATKLTDKQKAELAVKALITRDSNLYKDDKGKVIIKKVKELNTISELLEPMRDSDKGNDLWRVLNVIQEKLITGGYKRTSEASGRIITVPGIGNPVRNVQFNKDLWTMAETFITK